MIDRKVEHATFVLTRDYKANPEKVFAAFKNKASKRRWFIDGDSWETSEYTLDLRPGGWEIWRGAMQGGPEMRNNCYYFDVVENEPLVFSYEMYMGDARISVSLGTIILAAHGTGTRLTMTEQGAYLDMAEPHAAMREQGTVELLEKLGLEVDG